MVRLPKLASLLRLRLVPAKAVEEIQRNRPALIALINLAHMPAQFYLEISRENVTLNSLSLLFYPFLLKVYPSLLWRALLTQVTGLTTLCLCPFVTTEVSSYHFLVDIDPEICSFCERSKSEHSEMEKISPQIRYSKKTLGK